MFKKLFLASALLATFASAQAQTVATMNVLGSVLPPPCNITMSGGGSANFGTIPSTTVRGYGPGATPSANPSYQSPLLNIPFSIVCSAATKLGIAITDNNPTKVISEDADDPIRFGLVNGAGTSSVGHFKFYFGNISLDGNFTNPQFLSSKTGTAVYSNSSAAGTRYLPYWASSGSTNSFMKASGGTVPDSFTTISGNLATFVDLNKAIIDSASTAVQFSGSSTLTLVYL